LEDAGLELQAQEIKIEEASKRNSSVFFMIVSPF